MAPLFPGNAKCHIKSVGILNKEKLIRNIKKNNHKMCWKINIPLTKRENNLFITLGHPVSEVASRLEKKHKLCRGSSNKHSYQVWFQLTQWFQRRRLKCKSLQTMMTTTYNDVRCKVMTIPHITLINVRWVPQGQ